MFIGIMRDNDENKKMEPLTVNPLCFGFSTLYDGSKLNV